MSVDVAGAACCGGVAAGDTAGTTWLRESLQSEDMATLMLAAHAVGMRGRARLPGPWICGATLAAGLWSRPIDPATPPAWFAVGGAREHALVVPAAQAGLASADWVETVKALNLLRQESTLQWTFLSPAILLEPGERTGHYRLGTESPLMNGDQPGKISVADLAVAIVDELEAPRHLQQRFTVAY